MLTEKRPINDCLTGKDASIVDQDVDPRLPPQHFDNDPIPVVGQRYVDRQITCLMAFARSSAAAELTGNLALGSLRRAVTDLFPAAAAVPNRRITRSKLGFLL